MATTIYCIEDINDLKYVGSTTCELRFRLSGHKRDAKVNKGCSSSKLNLYNCIIYPLEVCERPLSKERERYWIDRLDSVNVYKLNGRDLEMKRKRDRERMRRIRAGL